MPYGILAADQISTSVTGVSLGAGNATLLVGNSGGTIIASAEL